MPSKCHTDKFRRRRAKEIQNKGQREVRERDRQMVESLRMKSVRLHIAEAKEWAQRTRWEYWRQDPVRYALLKRLVNAINYKVQTDPLYRLSMISNALRRVWR